MNKQQERKIRMKGSWTFCSWTIRTETALRPIGAQRYITPSWHNGIGRFYLFFILEQSHLRKSACQTSLSIKHRYRKNSLHCTTFFATVCKKHQLTIYVSQSIRTAWLNRLLLRGGKKEKSHCLGMKKTGGQRRGPVACLPTKEYHEGLLCLATSHQHNSV